MAAREGILDRDAYSDAKSISLDAANADGTEEKVSAPEPAAV
ncbi:hypothetical protein [Streptomyces chattanoogensis]